MASSLRLWMSLGLTVLVEPQTLASKRHLTSETHSPICGCSSVHHHVTSMCELYVEAVVVMVPALLALPAIGATIIVNSVALHFANTQCNCNQCHDMHIVSNNVHIYMQHHNNRLPAIAKVTVYAFQLCIGHSCQLPITDTHSSQSHSACSCVYAHTRCVT